MIKRLFFLRKSDSVFDAKMKRLRKKGNFDFFFSRRKLDKGGLLLMGG